MCASALHSGQADDCARPILILYSSNERERPERNWESVVLVFRGRSASDLSTAGGISFRIGFAPIFAIDDWTNDV